jgi:hypothetical protein
LKYSQTYGYVGAKLKANEVSSSSDDQMEEVDD